MMPSSASMISSREARALLKLSFRLKAFVGGLNATVFFAGLSPQFPGVNQVNFSIPSGLGTAILSLQLQENGITTPDLVKIAVQ